MSTTADVLDHHLEAFREQDLAETMADYADDAVVVMHDDVLRGTGAIRALFENLYAEFSQPEASFHLDTKVAEGDTGYLVWHAETPQNTYEFATDTFVVEDGEIVTQTVAAKVTPKD